MALLESLKSYLDNIGNISKQGKDSIELVLYKV
jgi:hypothetical protein